MECGDVRLNLTMSIVDHACVAAYMLAYAVLMKKDKGRFKNHQSNRTVPWISPTVLPSMVDICLYASVHVVWKFPMLREYHLVDCDPVFIGMERYSIESARTTIHSLYSCRKNLPQGEIVLTKDGSVLTHIE